MNPIPTDRETLDFRLASAFSRQTPEAASGHTATSTEGALRLRVGLLDVRDVALDLQSIGRPGANEGRRRADERVGLLRFEDLYEKHNRDSVLLQITEPVGQELVVKTGIGLCTSAADHEMARRKSMEWPERPVLVPSSPLHVGEKIFAVGKGAHGSSEMDVQT